LAPIIGAVIGGLIYRWLGEERPDPVTAVAKIAGDEARAPSLGQSAARLLWVMLPELMRRLFWEIDDGAIDLEKHRDYVVERVMTRGGWDAMCWLRDVYPVPLLADFLRRKGGRLAPRERAYWSLITGEPMQSDAPGGGRPPWAGP
ncbi:MAG: hypothetical protein ABI461_14375, partial [Polyangiaceae bacterium]